MPSSLKEQIGYLLAEAEVDEINLNLIMAAASQADDIPPSRDSWDNSMWLLACLMDAGFLAVDLREEGIVPWPDQNRDAILAHIEERRRNGEEDGHLAMVLWFHLPEDRREEARAALGITETIH